ncbi:MAG TPA: hypothetical protein VH062_24660 [Polyangiaceae bacterium]|nr:hypothetical protein [Polyangiaceae bacterium]
MGTASQPKELDSTAFSGVDEPILYGAIGECATVSLGPYIILLWRTSVIMQGVLWCEAAFERVTTERAEGPLGVFVVMEPSCDITTPPDVRTRSGNMLKSNEPRIQRAAVVFEREGFAMTVLRSVITAINVASRVRFQNSVFSDTGKAADWLVTQEMRDSSAIRARHLLLLLNQMRRL